MDLPVRKHVRLKEYDYSRNGAYFVTVCAAGRACIFSDVLHPVGPDALIGPAVQLTELGRVVERYIQSTPKAYPGVKVERYVIMPNHIHLLLTLERGPMGASGPTVPRIIKALKGLVTREAGHRVWQDNYHEHIIRDDNDFLLHWRYIDQNPARWNEDEYYAETVGGAP